MPKKPTAKKHGPKHPRPGGTDWLPADVIEASGHTRFPIDPKKIAERWDIEVEGQPLEGIAGCLLMKGHHFSIGYSTRTGNKGFQNFTVAHELGHFFIPNHVELLFADGNVLHKSRGSFLSNRKEEREADNYAVDLLMPQELFQPALLTAGCGLSAIKRLANECNTSLTSTAIRYANLSLTPAVVILSSGKTVDFCRVSPELRSSCNGFNLRGQEVPRESNSWTYAVYPEKIARCQEEESECQLSTWFKNAPSDWYVEETIGLGRYGKVLTVLSIE